MGNPFATALARIRNKNKHPPQITPGELSVVAASDPSICVPEIACNAPPTDQTPTDHISPRRPPTGFKYFADLPTELRLIIYKKALPGLVILQPQRQRPWVSRYRAFLPDDKENHLALTYVSHQVREESLAVVLRSATFLARVQNLGDEVSLITWLNKLQHIGKLSPRRLLVDWKIEYANPDVEGWICCFENVQLVIEKKSTEGAGYVITRGGKYPSGQKCFCRRGHFQNDERLETRKGLRDMLRRFKDDPAITVQNFARLKDFLEDLGSDSPRRILPHPVTLESLSNPFLHEMEFKRRKGLMEELDLAYELGESKARCIPDEVVDKAHQ